MSKYAIIDYRVASETFESLSCFFDKIVLTKPLNVHDAIKGHTDIGLCKIDKNTITVSPSQYEYFKSELPGINVISGSSEPSGKYPGDVLYNAACQNETAIHNFNFTDKITLAVINQKFSKHINVQQGYSKCSICFINHDAVITDDIGIYNTLTKNGFDVLGIDKGDIILSGMNYGFFGGATGFFDNKLFLNGELKNHKSCKDIRLFLEKHDTELVEIKKGDIVDIGSIVCLEA